MESSGKMGEGNTNMSLPNGNSGFHSFLNNLFLLDRVNRFRSLGIRAPVHVPPDSMGVGPRTSLHNTDIKVKK